MSDYDAYSDDFEDYASDDFESFDEEDGEDDEKEVKGNEVAQDTPAFSAKPLPKPPQSEMVVVNKPRAKNGGKTKEQLEDKYALLKILGLEIMGFELLDMHPLSEYAIYMRNKEVHQTYTQTGGDQIDSELQTEEFEMNDAAAQCPENSTYGGSRIETKERHFNMGQLTKFVRKAGGVIESFVERNSRKIRATETGVESRGESRFSANDDSNPELWKRVASVDGVAEFDSRAVVGMSISDSHPLTLIVGYGACTNGDTDKSNSCFNLGLVGVWKYWGKSFVLDRILGTEGQIACVAVSPSPSTLVFAGTTDGSVILWNLRDGTRSTSQPSAKPLQYPSYTTAPIRDENIHSSPLAKVSVVRRTMPRRIAATIRTGGKQLQKLSEVVSHTSTSQGTVAEEGEVEIEEQENIRGTGSDDESSPTFQIASLDISGKMVLWSAVPVLSVGGIGAMENAGDDNIDTGDLGLSVDGKVKLVRMATIDSLNTSDRLSITNSKRKNDVDIVMRSAFDCSFPPDDPGCFLLAADQGRVWHIGRFGALIPNHYTSESDSDMTCVDFSPFDPRLFLAGCDDGHLYLYQIGVRKPVTFWCDFLSTASPQSGSSALVNRFSTLKWSQTNPTVFSVMDTWGNVYVFDLHKNDIGPVCSDRIEDAVSLQMPSNVPWSADSITSRTDAWVFVGNSSGSIGVLEFVAEIARPNGHDKGTLNGVADALVWLQGFCDVVV